MLIRLGNCIVDPEQIDCVTTLKKDALGGNPLFDREVQENGPESYATVHLISGTHMILRMTVDEIAAVLEKAGYLEPDEGAAPAPLVLEAAETEQLRAAYNAGFRWIARDCGGQLYAYYSKPIKLDSVWNYDNTVHEINVDGGLQFIQWDDPTPTSIAWLLGKGGPHD